VPHNPDVFRERLRRDTAKMLSIDDLENMTPADSVRLSRACMLRLELDDCETKKLNNQPFDVKAYVVASEALERLVGGDPASTAGHNDPFAGAREELARFLAGRAAAIARRDARQAAALESSKHQDVPKSGPINPDPAGSDVSDSGVPHPPPSPVAAGGCDHPLLISPPPPPPPASAAERAANVERLNSQPANPEPGPLPEWRRWVDENGIRTSPWSGGRY
jgi:hypothetical protein